MDYFNRKGQHPFNFKEAVMREPGARIETWGGKILFVVCILFIILMGILGYAMMFKANAHATEPIIVTQVPETDYSLISICENGKCLNFDVIDGEMVLTGKLKATPAAEIFFRQMTHMINDLCKQVGENENPD